MMLKIPDIGYLEIDEEITVEKKVRLFEDLSTIEGDFSYSFTIPKTNNNVNIIKIYAQSSDNRWRRRINAVIQDDSGIDLYIGFLRIEEDDKRFYTASFFSGNSDWIDTLNVPLNSLSWSVFDSQYNASVMAASWAKNSGMVFSLCDRGALISRSERSISTIDLQPFLYVRDVISRALSLYSIKLQGDIVNDPLYNSIITTSNSLKIITDRLKNNEVRAAIPSFNDSISQLGYAKLDFSDVVSEPNYNSPNNNYSTANRRYTFSDTFVQMEIEYNITIQAVIDTVLRVRLNGSTTVWLKNFNNTNVISGTISPSQLPILNAGDYLEVEMIINSGSTITTIVFGGSYVVYRPKRFLNIDASLYLTSISASEFISDIFRSLNCFVNYNGFTKVLTVNTFNRITTSESINLTNNLNKVSNNFTDVSNNYAKRNLFTYAQQSSDEITQFNERNVSQYGSGYIDVDNDFIEEEAPLLESSFVAPFQYFNNVFKIDLISLNCTSINIGSDTVEITSVSDSAGMARFNHTTLVVPFVVGSFVRLTDASNKRYNGDYIVDTSNTTGFTVVNKVFVGDSTANAVSISIEDSDNEDQIIALNNVNLNLIDISTVPNVNLSVSNYTNVSIATFLRTKYSIYDLTFPSIISLYWKDIGKLLSNSIIETFDCVGLDSVDFKQVGDIKRIEVEGEGFFIMNSFTGYSGSKKSSEVRLLKLS